MEKGILTQELVALKRKYAPPKVCLYNPGYGEVSLGLCPGKA